MEVKKDLTLSMKIFSLRNSLNDYIRGHINRPDNSIA